MPEIYGVEIEAQVGSVIQPDAWKFGEKLLPCEWEKAQFRVKTWNTEKLYPAGLAVNIEVTGRTWQRRNSAYWCRIQIEFVGDGEPSTFSPGWLLRTW